MLRIARLLACAAWAALMIVPAAGLAQENAAVSTSPAASAKTWLENRQAIEEYLRVADVIGEEEIPVGFTKPRRMRLEPGGPVEYFAFKDVPPRRFRGQWESYKSEIAAYELDKLLGLDMVPPTVERRVRGTLGAAVMWCRPAKSFNEFGGVPQPSDMPKSRVVHWVRQMIRAQMFDNLTGNKDPNLGNWLVDPSWNLILIDKTRAFTTDTSLVHKRVPKVEMVLWERMLALTEESLAQAIGPWVGRREIRAMLERRKKMKIAYDALITERGEAAILR